MLAVSSSLKTPSLIGNNSYFNDADQLFRRFVRHLPSVFKKQDFSSIVYTLLRFIRKFSHISVEIDNNSMLEKRIFYENL